MTSRVQWSEDPEMGRLLEDLAARAAPGLVEEAVTAARAEAKALLQRELVMRLLKQSAGLSADAGCDGPEAAPVGGPEPPSGREEMVSWRAEPAAEERGRQAFGQGREQAAGQPTEQAAGQRTEQAVGQGREQAAGQRTGQAAGQRREQAGGQPTEQAAGQPTQQAAGQQAGRPSDPSLCARSHPSTPRRTERGKHDWRRGSCYLYGITDAAPSCVDGLAGIGGANTEAIVDDDLVAIISPVDARSTAWSAVAGDAPDLATLTPLLRAHERVLEDLLDAGAVVPVRFGLTFPDPRDISGLLHTNKAGIRAALDRVRGKVEWGLTVSWDVNLVKRGLESGERSGIAPANMNEASAGRRYLDQRRAERRSAERLDSCRAHMAATLHDRLAALSDAAVAHRPDAPHARLRSGLQPLLRASYLVAHDEAQHFRSAIERELQSGREWSLTGELTGPWPPYHFVALDAPELQP